MAKQAPGETIGTVQRVIEVLRHLAEDGETTIKDLAAAIGLAPSTCHRLLDLLAREGLVERDPERRDYRIGAELFRISALIQSHYDVRALARPFLQQVVDACDESCVLCLYLPAEGRMMFAELVDSSQLLRYQLTMNTPLSLLWGASGRCILAFLPDEEVERIRFSEGPAPASGARVPSRAALERELVQIRVRGYAVSHGEKIAGAVGIGAPVYRAGGDVLGGLAVTVPEGRVTSRDEQRLGELVRRTANAFSAALGFRGPRVARAAQA